MKVLININRLGGPLTKKEIDFILEIAQNIDSEKEKLDKEFDANKHFAIQLVEWFGISSKNISREMLERYAKMSPKELYIPFTLAKPEKIEQRIISPLVSAKRLGCIGEFLASIALSGLVGEMLAIFLWEVNIEERKDKNGITIKDQKLFGEGFSQLPQNQRINILQAFSYIDSDQVGKSRELASRRNDILHSWTDSLTREEIEKYVISCYSCAAFLMKGVFGLELSDPGSLKMNPKIMKYLEKF